MEQSPIITLTTDFGYKDPYVGIMKGVIFGINPAVKIADLCHEISPQNIMEASFAIETSFSYFPHKAIHVVVVDPGVGSMRRPILVATDHHYFIGPDNGVFSRIYPLTENITVIHITSEHYFLPQKSATFHGRDIFAPAAAWLSRGIDILNFGDPVLDYVTLPVPVPVSPSRNILEGEIIYTDRFGNLTTNISAGQIDDLGSRNPVKQTKILVKGREAPLKTHYAEVRDKELYSLINSFGYLELFTNGSSAASDFGLAVGEKVGIILS
jgi:S-adenosyl-L-methionine hydrolase (adenosine-forming)